MADIFPSLDKQIANAEENLRLITDRKAEFTEAMTISLALIKDECWLENQLVALRSRCVRVAEVDCPYRSLKLFAEHVPFFFGRTEFIETLGWFVLSTGVMGLHPIEQTISAQ